MPPWHWIRGIAAGTLVRRWWPSPPETAGILRISSSVERTHGPPSSWIFPVFGVAQARFFAAPVQMKQKPSTDAASGPRINDAITSPYVRLVVEDGHCVVSRHEALERAKRLNLDLVEVQRNADPPVCKIMDYFKEKFKQELKDKERAKEKQKSTVALRSGDNKEIRFKGKTELKDLKMKADAVVRLMEKGYRVKCTAMPTGKGEEDLGDLLSRLIELIQGVTIIESGPHVETSKAYVIVRHVKFAFKKSGKKASKVLEEASKSKAQDPDANNSTEQAEQGGGDRIEAGIAPNFSSLGEEKKTTKEKEVEAHESPVGPECNRCSRNDNPNGRQDQFRRPERSGTGAQNRQQQFPPRWQEQTREARDPRFPAATSSIGPRDAGPVFGNLNRGGFSERRAAPPSTPEQRNPSQSTRFPAAPSSVGPRDAGPVFVNLNRSGFSDTRAAPPSTPDQRNPSQSEPPAPPGHDTNRYSNRPGFSRPRFGTFNGPPNRGPSRTSLDFHDHKDQGNGS